MHIKRSKIKVAAVSVTTHHDVVNYYAVNYQSVLSTLWLDRVKEDKSGIFEGSIIHGECLCCTKTELSTGRGEADCDIANNNDSKWRGV